MNRVDSLVDQFGALTERLAEARDEYAGINDQLGEARQAIERLKAYRAELEPDDYRDQLTELTEAYGTLVAQYQQSGRVMKGILSDMARTKEALEAEIASQPDMKHARVEDDDKSSPGAHTVYR